MAISSMTGFARIDGSEGGYSWTWEVKSVNSRGLDMRFRLPPGFDGVEAAARASAAKKMTRGNLSVNLVLQRTERAPKTEINRDVLAELVALTREFRGDAPPDIETLLTVRGVVEISEQDEEDEDLIARRDARIAADFDDLADALVAARRQEGDRLEVVVGEHFDRIAELTAAAADLAAMQPEKRTERLKAQIDELLGQEVQVSGERLAQEVALIVARGDVREELDRLIAHTESGRELLSEGGAVGRRLDFLCQEFNREANTLCSKSSDLELTKTGLELKASIERLREQIQNIE